MDLYIREDSLHEKLYLLSGLTLSEYIICDLALDLTDTMIIDNTDTGKLLLVPSDIYFKNNRKVIEFNNINKYELLGELNLKFIEGIGPNWGFFTGFNEYNNLLLCIYNDDSITFKISEDSQCNYWWVGDECINGPCNSNYNPTVASKNLNINVIQDHQLVSFELLYNDNDYKQLYLFNILGQLIFTSGTYDQMIFIRKELLPSTILIYRIISNGSIITGKTYINY